MERRSAQLPEDIKPEHHVPSDEDLARAAEGSGFSVLDLRSLVTVHPTSFDDLMATAHFARRVREGKEALTSFEI